MNAQSLASDHPPKGHPAVAPTTSPTASSSGFSKLLFTFMLHHWFIPTGLSATGIPVSSWRGNHMDIYGRSCRAEASWQLPGQPAQEWAAGTSSSPPASFLQFPWGHQILLPRCHLGEIRRSKAEWLGLGKAEKGGSGGRGSFPLYGLIFFQLSGAKNLTRRKITPSLPHVSADEAFPSLCHAA